METATSVGEAVILRAAIHGDRAECLPGSLVVQPKAAPGPADVLVRPEQIVGLAPDAPGSNSARVREVSYFGREALVRLELRDGSVVTARTPGYASEKAGDAVSLEVRGPVHALPA